MIGPTSVGKTTLLNKTFELNLTTGLGKATSEATVVKETEKAAIWDVPGINKDWGFYQPKHLGFFKQMSKVYVLFDREIDDIKFIVKMLAAMGLNVEYVRTKCDLHQKGMKKTINEQIQIDLQELR